MKLSLRISFFVISFAWLIPKTMGASLKGSIQPSPPYRKVYLFVYQGDRLLPIDSSTLKTGKFSFKSKEKSFPRGVYRIGPSPDQSSSLVLGNEDVEIQTDGRNWEDATILNSKENEPYLKFRDLNKRFSFEMQVLETKYRNMMPQAQSDRQGFETKLAGLRAKADSLVKDQQLKYMEWQTTPEGPYFLKILRLSAAEPAASPETYITEADFNDPENLRADVWINRVSLMFQKFGEQDAEKWVILGDQVIGLTQPGTPAREVALRAVARALQPLEQNGLNAAYDIAKRYTQEFPGKVSAEFIKGFTAGPPSVGEMAPEIELADRNGKPLKLSSLRGKIVLLDFWASWCGPCRHENPTVVMAYQKFEPKGFTVFSVSLDQSKEKWLAAIAKDGLAWNNHVSDLKGWQSAGAAQYKVTGIPATFLLDRNGKIIAKNLRGAALENKLQELLGP